ncbi:MAG: GNAT family N-acetyltransferase [Caldilineaceae bacterium SB0665_bin_25]|nr:GNAT family N-acetyltransferase [Caldilineaceae bacterium SB0665_bin_25]MYD61829.1 GNAT family N-acetyltransferase [Gemmatimonadota bacterium]
MKIKIRKFNVYDSQEVVEILRLNNQYQYPEIEGPEAMRRVAKCDAAIFLVAEVEGVVRGIIRGIYDGSRALIHLLSVHPDYQRLGIGSMLVEAICEEFTHRGTSSFSVTVTKKSASFWERHNFQCLPVFLMLKSDEK